MTRVSLAPPPHDGYDWYVSVESASSQDAIHVWPCLRCGAVVLESSLQRHNEYHDEDLRVLDLIADRLRLGGLRVTK